MNVLGTGTVDAVMLAQLRADTAALLQDTDTRSAVEIFISTGGVTTDVATGLTVTAETVVSTTGWLADLTWRQLNAPGSTFQIGDRALMVPTADLATAPEVGARVRVGTDYYAVLMADTDPVSLRHRLFIRRTS